MYARVVKLFVFCAVLVGFSTSLIAQESMKVPIYVLNDKGTGAVVGSVTVNEGDTGVILHIKVNPNELKSGTVHGFHLHENADLGPTKDKDGNTVIGGKAGGHWDPDHTMKHLGPQGKGHRGDLPPLQVNSKGGIDQAVKAPRINFSDLKGRALIIHVGGDNFSDKPLPLGGGDGRVFGAMFK